MDVLSKDIEHHLEQLPSIISEAMNQYAEDLAQEIIRRTYTKKLCGLEFFNKEDLQIYS